MATFGEGEETADAFFHFHLLLIEGFIMSSFFLLLFSANKWGSWGVIDELQEPGESSHRISVSEVGLKGFPVADQKVNLTVWADFYFELLFGLVT